MMVHELVWALSSALFASGWALAAYFARRDRASVSRELEVLEVELRSLEGKVDALRDVVARSLIEQEHRLTRVEAHLGINGAPHH